MSLGWREGWFRSPHTVLGHLSRCWVAESHHRKGSFEVNLLSLAPLKMYQSGWDVTRWVGSLCDALTSIPSSL